MPAERVPMRRIRDVLRLKLGQGASERQIAKAVGVAGIGWPIPDAIDDGELERRLFPAHTNALPSRPPPDWNHIHRELQRRSMTLQSYICEQAITRLLGMCFDPGGIPVSPSPEEIADWQYRCCRRRRIARPSLE